MYRRMLVLVLSLTLLILVAVAGTLTWLQAQTEPITNTFVAGDIKLRLTDTTGSYKMVPGVAINEEIKVTVEAGSEACYVYIKVEKSQNFDTFLANELEEGWVALDNSYPGIYYRKVDASTADQPFNVLLNNMLTTKSEITKAQLNALTDETYPKLIVTAYAVQQAAMDNALDAWNKTFGENTTPSIPVTEPQA